MKKEQTKSFTLGKDPMEHISRIVIQLKPWELDGIDGCYYEPTYLTEKGKETIDFADAHWFRDEVEATRAILSLDYPINFDSEGNAYPRVVRITECYRTDDVLFHYERRTA